jgi:hypothetical protein
VGRGARRQADRREGDGRRGGSRHHPPISWDDWFAKFDESGLALLFQEETAGGERSNFNKLVKRETVEGQGAKKRAA